MGQFAPVFLLALVRFERDGGDPVDMAASAPLHDPGDGVGHQAQAVVAANDHGLAVKERRRLQRAAKTDHAGVYRYALVRIQRFPGGGMQSVRADEQVARDFGQCIFR